MNCLDPWSPIILQDHCPIQNWDKIKLKCDNALVSSKDISSDLEVGDSISTVVLNHNPFGWEEFAYFKEWLNPRLKEAVRQWDINYPRYDITGSWINRHYKSGKTLTHSHRATEIVVVYYLQVPENSGRLLVKDPMEYHWNSSISINRGQRDISGGYPIDVSAGDVLFFPGWLYHSTEESTADEPRYIMSINYAGKW
jgi:uncharacterized protein (TIGR02466 family)